MRGIRQQVLDARRSAEPELASFLARQRPLAEDVIYNVSKLAEQLVLVC